MPLMNSNSSRLRNITYQVSVSSETIGSLMPYRQGKSAHNRLRCRRHPADARSSQVTLAEAHGKTVGINQPIKVVWFNVIRVDYGDLFKSRPSKSFQNHGTDTSGTHHADLCAGKAGLRRETPTVQGAFQNRLSSIRLARMRW